MTTTFPFTVCCQMLGVAPKTLRHWLSATQMEPTGQGTDSRLKLLTAAAGLPTGHPPSPSYLAIRRSW